MEIENRNTLHFGQLDEACAAAILAHLLDENSLLIASSDLSHYLPYEKAKAKDAACVKAACESDVESMADADACGRGPMLTLLHIARQKGWKAKLLDYRTSGDTAGKKDAVVGYMAVAYYEEENAGGESGANVLSADDKKFLLRLARQTIEESAKNERLPAVDETKLSAALKASKGCFVTLHKDGNLRGCIGNIVPRGALYAAVMDNARAAALRDWRFEPVTAAEIETLHLEISVLTAPQALQFQTPEELLAKLRPNVDGVVLSRGGNQATYLPQVWEQLPKKEDFLSSLARKAGLSADDWRKPGLRIETYQVELFEEEKPGKTKR